MHHSDFIATIASIVKPELYVELGLYEGETMRKVLPHTVKAFGVDMKKNSFLEELEKCNSKLTVNKTTEII